MQLNAPLRYGGFKKDCKRKILETEKGSWIFDARTFLPRYFFEFHNGLERKFGSRYHINCKDGTIRYEAKVSGEGL